MCGFGKPGDKGYRPIPSQALTGIMGPAFPFLQKVTAENALLKQQLQTRSNELNSSFPMSDPLGRGPANQQNPSTPSMENASNTYFSRATPKFNFRSSQFSIQNQPEQSGESGLNIA